MSPIQNFEQHSRHLVEPDLPIQARLQMVMEVRDSLEIAHTAEYLNFLKCYFRAFSVILLQITKPQFVDNPEHKLRNIVGEILNRLPHSEVLRPFVQDLLKVAMQVLTTDNEENGLICIRIIFDLLRKFRPTLENEVQPFLDFVCKIYQNFKLTVSHFFEPGSVAGEAVKPMETSLSDQGISTTSATGLQLNPSTRSFKIVTESPLVVMFLFQLYSRLVQANIPQLLPLMVAAISVPGPEKVPPHLKTHFIELKGAQVKTVSFLTYLLKSYADYIRPHEDSICKSIVNLLVTCSDSVSIRKELLISLKHVLGTDFRRGLFPLIDTLLEERVLVGTGRACFETLRPLAYSLLAEIVHHVQQDLSLAQLSRIIYLFSSNMHDASLSLSIHTTCARLMPNLVEPIFEKGVDQQSMDEARVLLGRILDAFVGKFSTFKRTIPQMLEEGEEGKDRATLRSKLELPVQMEEVCLNSEPVFDECDEFDVENSSVSEHDQESLGSISKNHPPPTVGLEFDSFEEAYNFYNVYAKEQGFGIRVSNSWFRSRRKERYRAKLSCSSAGFKKKSDAHNPRPETRTGCPAMIVIRMVDSKIWRIVEVELQHNHQVNPGIKRFYKSHKKMILAAREAQPPPDPITEIHTIKLHRTAVMDAGYNGFSNLVDGQETNFDNLKYLALKEGDGHTIYNYFCRMKLTNPNFFYLFDIDDDGRLRNVFWADARSRVSYSYFNDTVIIDTTCLTNKYEIPLISFAGVNNHGQLVLLGCGFLGHEKVDNFVWIFNAWLKCMLGCPPHVVITDQCKPLQTAVALVFPYARHCYSLQYIMHRVPEKLGGLKGYETIRRQLNKVVYESLKIAEFENYWADMIKQHGLGDNKWLQTLYNDRHLWVPVYLKDTFFAGTIPTKENEGLIAYFDGYVHKHTSFKEFIDKYDLALHRKNLKEAMAELESRKSSVALNTRCNFELQLSKLYTKEIFKKFQSEVEGMYSCFNTRQVNVNGSIITYIVKERVENEGNEKEIKKFEVLYEANELDIRCICGLFNYKGYLCRHALNVLNYNGVEEVPSRFILQRWKKDFKQRFIQDHVSGNSDTYNPVAWHKQLLNNALPVLEEGAQSQEHYMIALLDLEQLLNKFDLL